MDSANFELLKSLKTRETRYRKELDSIVAQIASLEAFDAHLRSKSPQGDFVDKAKR